MIGMNTALLPDTNAFSGIGFVIPSNTITKIVPILMEKGYYLHGTYGATMGAGQSGANVGGYLVFKKEDGHIGTSIRLAPTSLTM
jgi:S1-C subfamily serine protease